MHEVKKYTFLMVLPYIAEFGGRVLESEAWRVYVCVCLECAWSVYVCMLGVCLECVCVCMLGVC